MPCLGLLERPLQVLQFGVTVQKSYSAPLMLISLYSPHGTYSATFLLVARYNLYRGGADLARVREFKWRKAEAQEQLRVQERAVAEDVRHLDRWP